MIINIGTRNPTKTQSVIESVEELQIFENPEFNNIDVSSEIPDQPFGIEETSLGATNRSKNAFQNCDLSVGIESGLTKLSFDKTTYLAFTICAIFDGKNYYYGIGAGYELPNEISKLINEKNYEMEKAVYESGYTENKRLGKSDGLIGILSKGKITRKDITKPAVKMALIKII